MSRTIARALERLRAGGTFDEFERTTRRDWDRLVNYLYRRWQLPAGVEPEDLRQEMLLASWEAAVAWDPGRSVTLKTFVVWRSVTAAKHWLHKQRAAGKHGDHAPSRHPLAYAALGVDDLVQAEESEQFRLAAARDGLSKFLAAATPEEHQCLLAVLEAGSVSQAVDSLFEAGVYRRKPTARKAVRTTLTEVAQWQQ
jgi:DNA-directed RNA polymerase specialized sigma24 family protein